MASPRPQPTAIRELMGDTSNGKNPINRREPRVKAGSPIMPPAALCDDIAKRKWRSFCQLIEGYGILSEVDVDILVTYCNTWSLYIALVRTRKESPLIISVRNGHMLVHPAAKSELECVRQLNSLLDRFGLNPSARSRIIALEEDDSGGPTLFAIPAKPA
jgi:P27 family predicted phage terminase small subunit